MIFICLLLSSMIQSGSGNLLTQYCVRLSAHLILILILRLIIVIDLAHLLIRPLFLTPHVFEVLEWYNKINYTLLLYNCLNSWIFKGIVWSWSKIKGLILVSFFFIKFFFLIPFLCLEALNITVDHFAHLVWVTERHDIRPPYAVKFQVEF